MGKRQGKEALRLELERLVRGLEGDGRFGRWDEGEPEEVVDYIISRDPRAARDLVAMAQEGYPVTNALVDWVNAWAFEKDSRASSKMKRVYLLNPEWEEVERAVDALTGLIAHSRASALGYLALAGARLLEEEPISAFIARLRARK